jgi:ribosomal protein L34
LLHFARRRSIQLQASGLKFDGIASSKISIVFLILQPSRWFDSFGCVERISLRMTSDGLPNYMNGKKYIRGVTACRKRHHGFSEVVSTIPGAEILWRNRVRQRFNFTQWINGKETLSSLSIGLRSVPTVPRKRDEVSEFPLPKIGRQSTRTVYLQSFGGSNTG